MINELEAREVPCPYCGETIEVLIDNSIAEQQYIEDCQVCCRPINFEVVVGFDGVVGVVVRGEND